ncbi:hypothetical protein [Nonomuraea sp. NPDC005650]
MNDVDRDALKACFEALGADDVEGRALSEITEKVPNSLASWR